MENLIDVLESAEQPAIHEQNVVVCEFCGTMNKREPEEKHRREIRLFNLTQGAVFISLYDWFCPTFRKMKRYSGTTDAIYPAGKTYAYSRELMYFWLNQVCLQGLSFRTAYKTSNLVSNSPGLRYRNLKLRNAGYIRLDDDMRRNRRRASTAFYRFLQTIDTKNEGITSKLFSCETCEVPLSPMDLKELGIRREDSGNLKRMKAIVIDGTAAGILNRLPEMERRMIEMKRITDDTGRRKVRLWKKFVRKSPHRKVLQKLFDATREILGFSMKQIRAVGTTGVNPVMFWMTSDCVDIVGVEKTKIKFTKSECRLLGLLCNNNSCICPEGPTFSTDSVTGVTEENHCNECDGHRTVFLKKKEPKEVMHLLAEVFEITSGEQIINSPTLPLPSNASEPEGAESRGATDNADTEPPAHSDSSGSGSDSNTSDHAGDENSTDSDSPHPVPEPINVNNTGGPIVHLLLQGVKRNPQFVDSFLSVLHLMLIEPVAMPYLGIITGQGENNESPSMLSFTTVSLRLHEQLAISMENLVNCTHVVMEAAISLQDDCECNAALRNVLMQITGK